MLAHVNSMERTMNIQKISTSLTIGAFIVVLITGLLLFFDISTGSIRATHEWMSLFFALTSLLHIYSHQKIFVRYFSNKYLYLISTGLILGGVLFAISFNDIYSSGIAFERISKAKIIHLAPIFDTSPDELIFKLKKAGVSTVSTEHSLNEIAETNSIDVHEIMESLIR